MWCRCNNEVMCDTLSGVCVMCVVAMVQNIHTHSSYKLCWQWNEAYGKHSHVSLFIRYMVIVCVKVCWSGKQWFEVVQKLQPYVSCVWWCDVWLCVCDALSLFRSTKHNQTTNYTTYNERTYLIHHCSNSHSMTDWVIATIRWHEKQSHTDTWISAIESNYHWVTSKIKSFEGIESHLGLSWQGNRSKEQLTDIITKTSYFHLFNWNKN